MQLRQIRELFQFNRRERNGILILIMVLLVAIFIDYSLPFLTFKKEYDIKEWQDQAEEFYAPSRTEEVSGKIAFAGVTDANQADEKDLQRLGLPPGIVSNWTKYLRKGGCFKKKVDILKLYGMTREHYSRIEKYLVINGPDRALMLKRDSVKSSGYRSAGRQGKDSSGFIAARKKVIRQIVEINTADSAKLESLPGIGPVLASRIIKYRKLLGGFYSTVQIREIYGMTPELWQKASLSLVADSTAIQKLNINFLSLSELGRHPYIGFRLARKIVRQRDLNGKFSGAGDLEPYFSVDSMNRLLPYITTARGEP